MVKRVEEVSRLSGVSRRTLQYYDEEEILPAKRSEENYRLYDDAAMERLWEILCYKEMGFQLKEIKEILSVPKKERKKFLEQKMKLLEEKICDLEEQKELINSIEWYEEVSISDVQKGNGLTYKEYIKIIKKQQRERKSQKNGQGEL